MKVTSFNIINRPNQLGTGLQWDLQTGALKSLAWRTRLAQRDVLSQWVLGGQLYGTVGGQDEVTGSKTMATVFVAPLTDPPTEITIINLGAQPVSGRVVYSPGRTKGVGVRPGMQNYFVVDFSGQPRCDVYSVGSFPLQGNPAMMEFEDGSIRFVHLADDIAMLSGIMGSPSLDIAISVMLDQSALEISDNPYVNGTRVAAELAKRAKEQGLGVATRFDAWSLNRWSEQELVFEVAFGQAAIKDDDWGFNVGYISQWDGSMIELAANLDGSYQVLAQGEMPVTDPSILNDHQFDVTATIQRAFWHNFVRTFETA